MNPEWLGWVGVGALGALAVVMLVILAYALIRDRDLSKTKARETRSGLKS